MRIAIIGHGFVGKAVDYSFSHPSVEKYIFDPIYDTDINAIPNVDFAFVCVPTPMGENGEIDSSIVEEIVSVLYYKTYASIVIKSTVTPDVIENLTNRTVSRLIYNPEFLTERSAKEDIINPPFHIIGGEEKRSFALAKLYEDYSLCNTAPFYYMSAVEASFVKYAINCFLATKVTFFNQLYDVVTSAGCNFNKIIRAIGSDPRIGNGHTKVPGFDGKRGYGGACLPKDTAAFYNYNNSLTLINECININNEYRKHYQLDEREEKQNVSYE